MSVAVAPGAGAWMACDAELTARSDDAATWEAGVMKYGMIAAARTSEDAAAVDLMITSGA